MTGECFMSNVPNEFRTHGDHSAVDDEDPLPNPFPLTADEIRAASLASGRQVRAEVEKLPDSREKGELLDIHDKMEDFWMRAGDAFVLQWMMVALKVDS